jgi:hypothetical protein
MTGPSAAGEGPACLCINNLFRGPASRHSFRVASLHSHPPLHPLHLFVANFLQLGPGFVTTKHV